MMFIIYDSTTGVIIRVAIGTFTLSDFPEFDHSPLLGLSTTLNTAVVANPNIYYVDTSSPITIRLKPHLDLSASPNPIPNDGATTSTLTVDFKDSSSNFTQFLWRDRNTGLSLTPSYRSVYFPSMTTGWAVGSSGTIYTTSTSGLSWSVQTSGTSVVLSDVFFIDLNNGWIVGNTGTILNTSNGGSTWAPQTSGVVSNLNSVFFVDANNGWAVGELGVILNTTNGGTTWVAQTSGTPNNIHDVTFGSSTTGYAVADAGVILKTTNGGTTWVAQTSGVLDNLRSVSLNTNYNQTTIVYICGDSGTILKTTNGGTTWVAQTSGTSNTLESISFGDNTHGWAVGSSQTIKYTSDGTTWVSQTVGTTGANPLSVLAVPGTTSTMSVMGAGIGHVLISNQQEAVVDISIPSSSLSVPSSLTLTTVAGTGQITFRTFESFTALGIAVSSTALYDPFTTVTSPTAIINSDSETLNITQTFDPGPIVQSPSTARWRITVDNAGNIGTTPV